MGRLRASGRADESASRTQAGEASIDGHAGADESKMDG